MKYRYPTEAVDGGIFDGGIFGGGIFADNDEAKVAFCRMKLEEQELLEEQAASAVAAAEKLRNLPHWANAFSDEMNLEEKNKELTVAVGALANTAVQAVKAYLGNFTGLLGLVDTLKTQVMHMAWSSNESIERKAAVDYDESTGHYAVLLIERQSSAEDVKVPFTGAKTYTAKLKVSFRRAQAKNDAARQICQALVDQAAGDLVQKIEAMEIF